jgi:hypothetical protein
MLMFSAYKTSVLRSRWQKFYVHLSLTTEDIWPTFDEMRRYDINTQLRQHLLFHVADSNTPYINIIIVTSSNAFNCGEPGRLDVIDVLYTH